MFLNQLLQAITTHNIHRFKQSLGYNLDAESRATALESGNIFSPDLTDESGTPLLHLTIQTKCFDMAIILLDLGANIESVCKYTGNRPIHEAIGKTSVNMLSELISRGADINAVNKLEHTPLHRAATIGSVQDVATILTAEPILNPICCGGASPLDIAWSRGDINIIKLLFDAGARFFTTRQRRTDLHIEGCSFHEAKAAANSSDCLLLGYKTKQYHTPNTTRIINILYQKHSPMLQRLLLQMFDGLELDNDKLSTFYWEHFVEPFKRALGSSKYRRIIKYFPSLLPKLREKFLANIEKLQHVVTFANVLRHLDNTNNSGRLDTIPLTVAEVLLQHDDVITINNPNNDNCLLKLFSLPNLEDFNRKLMDQNITLNQEFFTPANLVHFTPWLRGQLRLLKLLMDRSTAIASEANNEDHADKLVKITTTAPASSWKKRIRSQHEHDDHEPATKRRCCEL